jgi:hypothetical protein
MIPESMTIQGLYGICLALTPAQRWKAARGPFATSSGAEGWLTLFAVVALIISVVLLFWVFAKHKRTERSLKQKIADLAATNRKLQRAIAQLKDEHVELLEGIIDAKPPKAKTPSLNPQEVKALNELGKRLR